jgi:hypothetical protein
MSSEISPLDLGDSSGQSHRVTVLFEKWSGGLKKLRVLIDLTQKDANFLSISIVALPLNLSYLPVYRRSGLKK